MVEEAVEDIIRVSKKYCNGDSPTWREMEKYGNHDPETYTRRNDCSWNDLLEEANLDTNLTKSCESYSKEELYKDINSFIAEWDKEKIPRQKDFFEWAEKKYTYASSGDFDWLLFISENYSMDLALLYKENPSKEILLKELERVNKKTEGDFITTDKIDKFSHISYSKFLQLAKSDKSAITKDDIPTYETRTRDEVCKIVREYTNKVSETPSLQEIKDCTNLRHNDIYDNFDSYTDVLIESGCYNVAPGRRIKIERLKKDIHSYYRQKEGGLPTTKEVAKFCVHDVYTFLRRFGPTWQDVLENVGFSDEDIIEYNQTEGDLDYGDNWRSVKANIRQRDGYVCRVCGHRNIDHNLDVHHIKPIRCFDSNTDYLSFRMSNS